MRTPMTKERPPPPPTAQNGPERLLAGPCSLSSEPPRRQTHPGLWLKEIPYLQGPYCRV